MHSDSIPIIFGKHFKVDNRPFHGITLLQKLDINGETKVKLCNQAFVFIFFKNG